MPRNDQPTGEKTVLVLQGGGALGAYQAGAYQALHEEGYEPDWIAGVSIGAINAAIIAGNPPEKRVSRLRDFWRGVSAQYQGGPCLDGSLGRQWFNLFEATAAMMYGAAKFFRPRVLPPLLAQPGSPQALSYYDTSPLEHTLREIVDFSLINSGSMRLSVGAVNVETGNYTYFDTDNLRVDAAHIMASGALPPAFAPVVIEGEAYWDGGLVSNTPLQIVLDDAPSNRDLCVFQIDLFSARGAMPKTIFDVEQRAKDIRYSSRTRLNTDISTKLHSMGAAAKRLVDKLPAPLKSDPDAQYLLDNAVNSAVSIVHLIHRPAAFETQAKDYQFSRLSVEEHWHAGLEDVRKTLRQRAWRERRRRGVEVFDLTQTTDPQRMSQTL